MFVPLKLAVAYEAKLKYASSSSSTTSVIIRAVQFLTSDLTTGTSAPVAIAAGVRLPSESDRDMLGIALFLLTSFVVTPFAW